MFNSLGLPEGEQIEHKMLSNAIEKAQKRIKTIDGYDIVRGSAIDCIIANELR